MKIVYRIDTDDGEKISKIAEMIKGQEVVIPLGDMIKVFVIKDDGEVTELK